MSERWEQSIQEWYTKSRTSNLEYLDLSETTITNKHLANNISVIYDRLNLLSRVSLKNFKQTQEQINSLDQRIQKLEQNLKNLTILLTENRPLTTSEVKTLVTEVTKQPKLIETEALKISEELNQKLKRVEAVLKRVETWVSS
jgi:polyhydroxyalkanoate synthesis regulator phasin